MKKLVYIILLSGIMSCNGQEQEIEKLYLSISPNMDQSTEDNIALIGILEKFLLSKNNSSVENEFWLDTDFDKHGHPYRGIYQIEKSRYGDNYYKPTLMELIDLEDGQKLLKIGFVGVHPETSEILIRCIYNIVAIKSRGEWKFKRSIEYETKDWQIFNEGNLTYYLPPNKKPNQEEVARQQNEIRDLCRFFETEPLQITYYSCSDPKKVFELKGFDYLPNMYYGTTGGMTDHGNVVYSGNNSEIYTHEIVHIYTEKIYPGMNRLLDEGMATYMGGSGKMDYAWHKEKLKDFMDSDDLDLAEHMEPYERLYVDNETSVPYMIGALICERTIRIYGKEKLFELFSSKADLWTILEMVDLTKDNLTEELKKELKLPMEAYHQK